MEDGNLTPMESKILAAIDDGTLTKAKLEKGVCALIKMELEQNEHILQIWSWFQLVRACWRRYIRRVIQVMRRKAEKLS